MTTFFLPLGGETKWQDNELRYMLRSLEQNFQDPFEIIVSSNREVSWLKNVTYFPVERFYPENFRDDRWFENYFDVLNKVRIFAFSDICPDHFVYIYDDVLLLKPIKEKDILPYPCNKEGPKWKNIKKSTRHGQTMIRSAELLGVLQPYNYESHAPLIYEREKLRELFTVFSIDKPGLPYPLGTTYFNYFLDDHLPTLHMENKWIAWFYFDGITHDCHKESAIIQATHDKVWINYSDRGLFFRTGADEVIYPLQEFIRKFDKKSKYER